MLYIYIYIYINQNQPLALRLWRCNCIHIICTFVCDVSVCLYIFWRLCYTCAIHSVPKIVFLKNTHSSVENEYRCPCTVSISNVNFTNKQNYVTRASTENMWSIKPNWKTNRQESESDGGLTICWIEIFFDSETSILQSNCFLSVSLHVHRTNLCKTACGQPLLKMPLNGVIFGPVKDTYQWSTLLLIGNIIHGSAMLSVSTRCILQSKKNIWIEKTK